MEDVHQRINRAAESILINERLTADLDDEPAQRLLDWGLAWAQMIAETTAGLDEAAANTIIKPRLKALRRMMRTVNRWAGNREAMDAAADQVLLGKLYERASQAATPPGSFDEQGRQRFLDEAAALRGSPGELVTALRGAIENAAGMNDHANGANDER